MVQVPGGGVDTFSFPPRFVGVLVFFALVHCKIKKIKKIQKSVRKEQAALLGHYSGSRGCIQRCEMP
jgi:hypothetical protein